MRITLQLLLHIQNFKLVFVKKDFDKFLDYCQWDHIIKLLPDIEFKFSKVYPLLSMEQSVLDTFLAENLYTDHIYSLKFLIAMLVFFIKKKNRSLRLIQDYKTLNAITVKNRYLFLLVFKLVSKILSILQSWMCARNLIMSV